MTWSQPLEVGSGISRNEVSRMCAELDRDLDAFRNRRLGHTAFPHVFADATYLKGRVRGRVVSQAVVIATGMTATGDREVLGVEVGDSEGQAFWAAFFKGLRSRSSVQGRDQTQLGVHQRVHRTRTADNKSLCAIAHRSASSPTSPPDRSGAYEHLDC